MRLCAAVTKALIAEAQGYDVIYGDTDSTFVRLRARIQKPMRRETWAQAGASRERMQGADATTANLTSALELEFETTFAVFPFWMPTIRHRRRRGYWQ